MSASKSRTAILIASLQAPKQPSALLNLYRITAIIQRVGARFAFPLIVFLLSLPLVAQTAETQTENKKITESHGTPAVAATAGSGSFTISNLQALDVPELRARALHRIVQDVVADHFHVPHKKGMPPLVLVLGEDREHFTSGGLNQVDTIYLQKWDEQKFVASDVSLTVQHLLVADSLNRMVEEISRDAHRFLPVSLDELRKGDLNQPNPPPAMGNPCIATMTNASQVGLRCEPRASLP